MTKKRNCMPKLGNGNEFSEGVILEVMQSSVFFQSKKEPVSLCWFSEEKKKFIDTKKPLAAILIKIRSFFQN